MARVVHAASCSLDGYIAGPGGDMSWLRPHLGLNPEAVRFGDEVAALLVGRRTFAGDDPGRVPPRHAAAWRWGSSTRS